MPPEQRKSHKPVIGRKPVIGLTGSIGAGKTTVSHLLGELGCLVIDSDRISHEELQSAPVKAALVGWWGESILDSEGSVCRKSVADAVFEQPAELARLEGVLYPRIERRRREIMESAGRNPDIRAIVIDAPKLIEAGLHRDCDAVVVVDADLALRLRRVADRGWGPEELLRREKLLLPLDKKREFADHVIVNNDGIAELRRSVQDVFQAMLVGFTHKHT